MEGERRWERVEMATCLGDEATNFRSRPTAADGSSAAATEERNLSPCLVSLHTNGGRWRKPAEVGGAGS